MPLQDFDIDEIRAYLKHELNLKSSQQLKKICNKNCKIWCEESKIIQDDGTINRPHYISKSNKISFVIAYLTDEGLTVGRRFVYDLAAQIHNENSHKHYTQK